MAEVSGKSFVVDSSKLPGRLSYLTTLKDLDDWAGAEKHEVAGNHMRFEARSELVLDESWRQSLSPLKQRAIELGTLLSRQTLPKTGAVR